MSRKVNRPGDKSVKTRRAIFDILKREGPKEALVLAKQLGVTGMAVRQHLYEMQSEKLVTFVSEARSVGRPAKLWKLAPESERYFPDAHAELVVGLIDAAKTAFGADGLKAMVAKRAEEQYQRYAAVLQGRKSVSAKLEALAELRSSEGYMAEVRKDGGQYLFIENHCPICAAAKVCQAFCSSELETFQRLLGHNCRVSRHEHITSGARRCAYSISSD